MYDVELFRKRLKLEIVKSGLTYKKIEEKTGICWYTVSNMIRGRSCGTFSSVVKLCDLLGVSIDSLVLEQEAKEDV